VHAFDRITCRGVTRVYGRTRALAGVDLELRAGEVTAILGANGAGKTTLLSILSTLLTPSSGEVRYGEVDHATAARTLRGEIGLVSHAALVYPQLSALENLAFAARLYGVKDGKARAEALLAEVGLLDSAWKRAAATYSRGMLQRLALARALIHDPPLLLLDEPFTGLDPDASERLMDMLQTARGRGRLVVLVTHDLDGAARLANRTAIMARGKIAHVVEEKVDGATLSDLYRHHSAASGRRRGARAASGG
jgi:heme exporter protein A